MTISLVVVIGLSESTFYEFHATVFFHGNKMILTKKLVVFFGFSLHTHVELTCSINGCCGLIFTLPAAKCCRLDLSKCVWSTRPRNQQQPLVKRNFPRAGIQRRFEEYRKNSLSIETTLGFLDKEIRLAIFFHVTTICI